MTSVFALLALACGKLLAWTWMDPAMGIVGAAVIARWSYGLIRDTGRVLLDAEVEPAKREAIRAAIEAEDDNRVADLHLWRVGPHHLAAILAIVTHRPKAASHYRAMLHGHPDLAHVTVEVITCPELEADAPVEA